MKESRFHLVLLSTYATPPLAIGVNHKTVIDYTEPPRVQRPTERAGRKLNPYGGAIALQAHDPGSTFYFKDIRIKRLP